MLAGKQFHCAVRGLTLLYEALSQFLLSDFFDWCEKKENINGIPPKFWKSLAKAQTSFDKDQGSCLVMVKNVEDLLLQHVLSLLKQFKKWGETQSPPFAYWVMLLDAVQLMLINIRSERQANWTLQMHTVASMLPYSFVTNRTNYYRWITVYLLEMSQIPLDIQTAFEDGEFSFTEIPGSFNGIWSDMAIEKTAKGDGGIVGLTRKEPALIRWTPTRHIAAQYSAAMKTRSGITSADNSVHQQEKAASMKHALFLESDWLVALLFLLK